MTKRIELDMTLIEGHMNVLVDTEKGIIKDLKVQGVDSRFFERFVVGFPLEDLPKITPRICGVCSASHHIASAEAVDKVYGVKSPRRAKLIRRATKYGIILNNQALHLTMMGLPDIGMDGEKDFLGFVRKEPKLSKAGMKLVKLGHEFVRVFGGRDIHPVRAVPGGVAKAPSQQEIEFIKKLHKEYNQYLEEFVKETLRLLKEREARIKEFENGADYFIGMVSDGGKAEYYEGVVKVVDRRGNEVARIENGEYRKVLREYSFDWTYIKPVTVAWEQYPRGSVKSGAIARINIADKMGTERADEMLDEFRKKYGRWVWDPLLYHEARLIETVHTYEHLAELLEDPDLYEGEYIVEVGEPKGEGVGIVEAPRGLLIHHVWPNGDKIGLFNVITPTALNAAAMEADLRQNLSGKEIKDDMWLYHQVASIIRSYDPCMSCATHSVSTSSAFTLVIREGGKVLRKIG